MNEEKELKAKHAKLRFSTETEANKYIADNTIELNRLRELAVQIREVEWQLMTPEEQKIHEEEWRKIAKSTKESNERFISLTRYYLTSLWLVLFSIAGTNASRCWPQ